MKIEVVKDRFGNIKGASNDACNVIRKFPQGEVLQAEIRRPRNAKFHRLFFALLNLVMENMPEKYEHMFPTIGHLLDELKFQCGYYEMHETIGGKKIPITKSISFAAMDEDEFGQFFSQAISVVRKYFFEGVDEDALRQEIDAELSKYG